MQDSNKHLLQVGRILHAIALCDGNLHKEEEIALIQALEDYRELLITNIAVAERERLMTTSDLIRSLESKREGDLNPFQAFRSYYEAHLEEFQEEYRDLILKKANDIATAVAKKNKSEIIMMAKLSLLLHPV